MLLYEVTSEKTDLEFESTVAENLIERTIRNVKNLLMLRMGEVPYDRYRGLDPALFELPYPEANEIVLQELDRCMLWEPDVDVTDGWLEIDDKGETIVHCVIKIKIGDEG